MIDGRAASHQVVEWLFISLECFEPIQQSRLALPSRRFAHAKFWISLFQSFSEHVERCPGVSIGSIQASMSQPIPNHGGINPCRTEAHPGRVTEKMRADVLARNGGCFGRRAPDIFPQLEPKPSCSQRPTIAIKKQRFVWRGLAMGHKRFEYCRRFRPDWRDPLLFAFTHQPHVRKRFQADILRSEAQHLLA